MDGEIKVKLTEGHLLDFQPLQNISDYIFKNRDFKDISFSEINQTCKIKGFEMEIEEMEIASNVLNLFWKPSSFDSLNYSYFKAKPYYIDYSFFVLVDKRRHIRGYYDGRYVSEIKRLTDEYQHLRLKELKQDMLNQNKIESK